MACLYAMSYKNKYYLQQPTTSELHARYLAQADTEYDGVKQVCESLTIP